MGDRYGRSDIIEISIGMPIWDMGYRFGIWYIDMVIYHNDRVILGIDMGDEAYDMGDESIDTVISHIDMGYLVTLLRSDLPHPHFTQSHSLQVACTLEVGASQPRQGFTLVHFSAQLEHFLWDRGCM